MLSLSDPDEVRALGLTSPVLRALLADAVGTQDRVVMRYARRPRAHGAADAVRRSVIVTLYRPSGGALFGMSDLAHSASVIIYKGRRGWGVCISRFVMSVFVARMGGPLMARHKVRLLWLRHGLPPKIFVPEQMRWHALSQAAARTVSDLPGAAVA